MAKSKKRTQDDSRRDDSDSERAPKKTKNNADGAKASQATRDAAFVKSMLRKHEKLDENSETLNEEILGLLCHLHNFSH